MSADFLAIVAILVALQKDTHSELICTTIAECMLCRVTFNDMPLPKELFDDIHALNRNTAEWFSIPEIKKHHPELFATEYVQKGTGKIFVVSHQPDDVYRKLEQHAARLLEREVRSYEVKLTELCSTNSAVTSLEDDNLLIYELTQYLEATADQLSHDISTFTQHKMDDWAKPWSRLDEAAKRLASEMSVTFRLAGEIARLELTEAGYEPLDRIKFSQTKIERFYAHFFHIPHPFDTTKSMDLPYDELNKITRLLVYVIFRDVNEARLRGFENKFVSAFLRYLTCPRDSSTSAVEQIAALFEPFLKKLSFIFSVRDPAGNPIWPLGLDGLITGLKLTSTDLKKGDLTYWQSQPAQDAVFRLAYQLRHKGAHEAHDYAYYERERNAYFVFAAILLSCKILVAAQPQIANAVAYQGDVDTLRDLFVKIDELVDGPDGPRMADNSPAIPTRLQKLLAFSSRAQAIWPACSTALAEGLQSEYVSVKYELAEADREANIESYLEDMRDDYYS